MKIFLTLLLILASQLSQAFYCSSSLIRQGITLKTVETYCGKPDIVQYCKVENYIIKRIQNSMPTKNDDYASIKVLYNFGSSTFMQVLTFNKEEILTGIKQLGYGTPSTPDIDLCSN
jgi:hypothetical protein